MLTTTQITKIVWIKRINTRLMNCITHSAAHDQANVAVGGILARSCLCLQSYQLSM